MSFFDEFKDYNLNIHGVRLPQIDISNDLKLEVGADIDCDNFAYLRLLCRKGYSNWLKQGKIGKDNQQEYINRVKYELEVFKKHGLVDYVLLVHDVLSWCDRNNIPRGIARGSASGSLVFALIGCNKIDPILHSLPFTRFISEARLQSKEIDGVIYLNGKTAPDYDCDVSYMRRGEVLRYIEEKFKGKTSKISTLSTLTGKILIKDVVKTVLEYSEEQAKNLSDMIERHFGKVERFSETYKNNKEFKEWADKNQEAFQIAQKLENLVRGKNQHASGMAISYHDITEIIPLELSQSKEVVSSYNMEDIVNLTLKLDILGLRQVDVNSETCKLLGIKMESVDINHPSIYDYYKVTDNYYGLFQIEEGLTKRTVMEVQPRNIDELAVCISISRPGTCKDIPKYVKYIKENVLEPIYPSIDNVLKTTANILLYQEEVTELLVKVYGFNEIDADQVRYCTGKKKREEMLKWEPILFKQGEKNKIPKEVTEKIWDTIKSSADYQFSKNHAYAYCYTTAIGTYLKVNHPKEYFISLLKMAKAEPNPIEVISAIQRELGSFGIKLLPPHILKSELDFSIEGDDIRFGLLSIKGISDKSIEKLNNFRHKYANKFEVFRGAEESGLSIGILSSLIMAGCLDNLKIPQSRSKIVLESQLYNLLTEREKMLIHPLGEKFNYDLIAALKHLNKEAKNEKGNPLIKDSRMNTLKKNYEPYLKIYNQNSKSESFANYFYETELLGFSYSQKLSKIFSTEERELCTIKEVNDAEKYDFVTFAGKVVDAKLATSKNEKKTRYFKLVLNEETGTTTALIFNDKIDYCKEMNAGKLPEENDIVIIRGKKMEDAVFADSITIQTHQIFTRLSQVKDKKQLTETPTQDTITV